MPILESTTTGWKQTVTRDGSTLTAEGKDGEFNVRITIEDADRGLFRPARASIVLDGPQWTQLVAKIERSRRPEG
jgi:hypothetical protein